MLKGSGALVGNFVFEEDGVLAVTIDTAGRLVSPNLENVGRGDLFAALRMINLTVFARIPRMIVDLGPAGDLTPAQAEAITVNVANPAHLVLGEWSATVREGRLVLINPNPPGTILLLR